MLYSQNQLLINDKMNELEKILNKIYLTDSDKYELLKLLNNNKAPTFAFYKIDDNKYKIFVNKQSWNETYKQNTVNDDFNSILELSNTEDNIILIWSAIDSYEILSKKNSKERIKELGINLEG